jgi:hypothetical protein
MAAGKAPEHNQSKEDLFGPHLVTRVSEFAYRLCISDWLSVNGQASAPWLPSEAQRRLEIREPRTSGEVAFR